MLLLAADTSGKSGSIALAGVHAGTPDIEILEVVPLAGGTFSAQLVPQIASLLEKHGFSKTDIAGFAVASGPGSFTGLRVGLAAIKALGETLQKPIAAVSLLEAVAGEPPILAKSYQRWTLDAAKYMWECTRCCRWEPYACAKNCWASANSWRGQPEKR